MRRPALTLVAGALALGSALAAQPVFQSGIDLVTFSVTVVDDEGRLVTDLDADDFVVTEDGVPQDVRYFAAGFGNTGTESEHHLGLMLDTSGSMETDLPLARSAAIKFLRLVPEADDITLVDFDTEVRIAQFPRRDFPRIVERIRTGAPEGQTALYDALGVYLDGADRQGGRTILVMYTDGGDTRSELSWSDTLTLLKASDVTVFAVGLLEHAGSARFELRQRLEQMTALTGGEAYFPDELDDLDASYARILEGIRAQYHIGYASTNAARDGTWRNVSIAVARKGLKVRARQGYFAILRERLH